MIINDHLIIINDDFLSATKSGEHLPDSDSANVLLFFHETKKELSARPVQDAERRADPGGEAARGQRGESVEPTREEG